ncbi:alpha/beta-hydrolase [Ramaria rubella]|nr:alpha/beta-hydrolase [Ramaria rubella]
MAFTIENVASAPILSNVVLSPDGRRVVYHVAPSIMTDDRPTSSLWYSSDTTKADSAKQLTSGCFHDVNPVWNLNSDAIFFLSDRHKPGGPKQIYTYFLDGPGEPSLLIEAFKENKRGIDAFRLSPDGRYIAFSSADEPTAEEERKDAEKDDARVWGEVTGQSRLRLYTISTGEVRTLVEDKRHVVLFVWSPDSKELLYQLAERPDAEAMFLKFMPFFVMSILPASSNSGAKHISNLACTPMGNSIIWPLLSHREFYATQAYIPTENIDAFAIHRHSFDPHGSDTQAFYSGETDDVFQLIDLQSSNGEFAVVIASGITSRVDILNRTGKLFTLFDSGELSACSFVDVKKVGDEYILAAVRSSGPKKETPDVWVGKIRGTQSTTFTTRLSLHFPWVSNHKLGAVETFRWTAEDGVPLEGMAWFPQGVDPSDIKKPLPTILIVHGGPYGRDAPELQPYFLLWHPILAEQGYLVLSPNYRHSAGRGHKFAQFHGTAGTLDWSDANGMVDEAVKRGFANKDKLAIGGWSHGGFMTAWGVTQTKNKFKCAIMGGGLTDLGAITLKGDLPDVYTYMGGAAPWLGTDVRLTGDPIRYVKDVETAVLILHGDVDSRVPVGQAIGFHRGLRRMSKYPDRHTLVLYPREDHLFIEEKHIKDVLKRVIKHYETWLK